MEEDGLDLEFGAGVDLKVCFCTGFAVGALEVLSDHDEGHEKYLYHVGQEEPEYEAGVWVEAEVFGAEHVPAEPEDGPAEDEQEEAHGADVVGDPHGELVER